MDYYALSDSHSAGNRHSHSLNSSSSQFRVSRSPVNLPTASVRHHNAGGGTAGLGTTYSAFTGSPVLQPAAAALFGARSMSGSGGGTFLNPTPPNHFNFPLRSNGLINTGGGGGGGSNGARMFGGYGVGSNGLGAASGGNNKGRNNAASNGITAGINQNSNKNKSNNDSSSQRKEEEPVPIYRIFKRGDSIPGINCPVVSATGINTSGDGGEEGQASSAGGFKQEGQGDSSPSSSSSKQVTQDKEISSKGVQSNKTPVSQVSDIARFHGLSVEYRLIGEKGPPHNPTFTVALHLGPEEKYIGQDSSIKRAQHAAASEALEKTELKRPTPRTQPRPRPFLGGGHGHAGNKKSTNWALMQLTTLADDLGEPISFVQQPVTIMDPFRRGEPPAVVSIQIGDRVYTGEGPNFNAAKNSAILVALKAMLKVKQEKDLEKQQTDGAGLVNAENKSPISLVHEMAMKRGLTLKFDVTKEEGPPHSKVFTVICTLGEDEATTEGQGVTKQAAKKAASELMLQKITEMPISSNGLPAVSLKSIQRGFLKQKVPRKKSSVPVVKDLDKQPVSPVSRLIQIAHIRKYKEPEFTVIAAPKPTEEVQPKPTSERERRNMRKKKPSFTIEVTAGPYTCRGIGPNKKAAKKAAAEAALIEMGYGPPAGTENNASSATDDTPATSNQSEGILANVNVVSARQIVPGIIVLNAKPKDGSPKKTAEPDAGVQVQTMITGVAVPASSPSTGPVKENVEKLAYLAKLLNVQVSYSDFPKKNEFLSVVSLATNPPQVAHGCGSTIDEAQNNAACKLMEELSDVGLNNLLGNGESDENKDK